MLVTCVSRSSLVVTSVRNAPRTASHLERFFEWSTARLGSTAERLIRDNLTSQVGQETPRYVFESSRAHGSIVGEKHTAVYLLITLFNLPLCHASALAVGKGSTTLRPNTRETCQSERARPALGSIPSSDQYSSRCFRALLSRICVHRIWLSSFKPHTK